MENLENQTPPSGTPARNKLLTRAQSVNIPPSPQMPIVGYGTGIKCYKMERSGNQSPWVLKKVSRKAYEAADRGVEFSQRLIFEASVLKALNHPNIVGFRAVLTEDNGRQCMAMEECTTSLGDMIEDRSETIGRPFPALAMQKVVNDVIAGLAYLHNEALILHCDIKSYNILIKGDFEICKICDFGVSMPLKSDGTLDETKIDGEYPEYVGTSVWRPPEVCQLHPIITVKADIYAFGVCLYEMVALKPPAEDFDDSCEGLDDTQEILDRSQEELDDSQDEIDESQENITQSEDKIDDLPLPLKRQDMPLEHLDDSYSLFLQVYDLCTNLDYTKRPTAQDLQQLINEFNNK